MAGGFKFPISGGIEIETCAFQTETRRSRDVDTGVAITRACELTLDPNTASRHLLLSSEDNRKVMMVREEQSYPDHLERFDFQYQVLCREGLTGHIYWEVEREGRVSTGVTYRGSPRVEGVVTAGLEGTTNPQIIVMMMVTLPVTTVVKQSYVSPPGSTRVGVYVDRPAGTLSFYRVSPDSLLKALAALDLNTRHVYVLYMRTIFNKRLALSWLKSEKNPENTAPALNVACTAPDWLLTARANCICPLTHPIDFEWGGAAMHYASVCCVGSVACVEKLRKF
ncbi:Stonustoxin subunit beta [Merluccius polli]|uniref:Stonustoxin subunit beta n=1 Tax=Merluccius polli TaxID=89951 RepID=A0AA47NNW6_MERPO|nr:Stonustoxin subunit beta [Merluccius polli]